MKQQQPDKPDGYVEMEDGGLRYKDYTPPEEEEEEEEVYIVKQNYGYFSILFSLVQTIILALMMWQCGVAPLKINPMIGPYPDALSEWGGKNSVLILEDNQWWRLITPILLHAGIIHLLGNVAVQLETGAFFEKEWGSLTWLIIYLSSAVGSSALSVVIMPNAISVGSSGAVMGLFGAKLSEVVLRAWERVRTKQDLVSHQVRKEQCCAVTCSVIVVLLFSFIPYVDWAAHVGGLLAGIAVGVLVFAKDIPTCCGRFTGYIVGVVMVVVFYVTVLEYMYSGKVQVSEQLRDVCAYYQQYFNNYVCKCMPGQYFNNNNNNN